MHPGRRGICTALVLALLIAPALSGCGSGEPTAAVAIAKSGILGGLADELKREDDEAEVREIREHEPQTSEERQEAREQSEAAAIQSAQAAEPEGG